MRVMVPYSSRVFCEGRKHYLVLCTAFSMQRQHQDLNWGNAQRHKSEWNSGGIQERTQKAWLHGAKGGLWEEVPVPPGKQYMERPPFQKKMNFSLEMACFGEFWAVFLKMGRTICISVAFQILGNSCPVLCAFTAVKIHCASHRLYVSDLQRWCWLWCTRKRAMTAVRAYFRSFDWPCSDVIYQSRCCSSCACAPQDHTHARTHARTHAHQSAIVSLFKRHSVTEPMQLSVRAAAACSKPRRRRR